MSYLDDQPLSPQELEAIENAESEYRRRYRRLSSFHKRQKKSYLPKGRIGNVDIQETNPYSVKTEYLKVQVQNEIIFDSNLYERVKNLIRTRWGGYPFANSLVCTSITITPIAGSTTTLLYRPDGNNNWYQIGQFYCPHTSNPNLRLSMKCPFTDSIYRDSILHWPFFKQSETGEIVQYTYVNDDIGLFEKNDTMPFLSTRMYGIIAITGITDCVTLDVSFTINVDRMRKAGPAYNRRLRFNVPRQRYIVPNAPRAYTPGIGWHDQDAPSFGPDAYDNDEEIEVM